MPTPLIISASLTGDFTYKISEQDLVHVLKNVVLDSSAASVFDLIRNPVALDLAGAIYGAGNGVVVTTGSSVMIREGAVLAAGVSAVRCYNGEGVVLQNQGLVDGKTSTVWLQGGGNLINNTGELRSWGAGSTAVLMVNTANQSNQPNRIENSGWIHAPGTAISINTGLPTTINNSGKISAGPGLLAIDAISNATIENKGEIEGGVTARQATFKLVNFASGRIQGSVATAGADTLIINDGQILEGVALGAGADTVFNTGLIRGDVDLGWGENGLDTSGEITGSVRGGRGIDRITNNGLIRGDVVLGDGTENVLVNVGGTVLGVIRGGEGRDIVTGGAGIDRVEGGGGDDSVSGGYGDDVISGGYGRDVIYGNQDNDVLYGNQDDDVLYGGQGQDQLFGGQGGDKLFGNAGDDRLQGNLGDDVLDGGVGVNALDGGEGVDAASYMDASAAVTVSLLLQGQIQQTGVSSDTLLSIENLYGSRFGDSLTGDAGANRIEGGSGNDLLSGGFGADLLFGGDDNDVLYGNQDADQLFGGQGADLLYGGQGDDLLNGGAGDDVLFGNLGADTFVFEGGFGHDVVADFAAGDRVRFGAGTFADFADVQAHAVQRADGLLLTDQAGDTVLLAGVTTGGLTAGMILFG